MIRFTSFIKMMFADKRQNFLSITGLTIGITVFLLINLYLKTELSFDKHIIDHENKFRVLKKGGEFRAAIFPYQAGVIIGSSIPELKSLCMVDRDHGQIGIASDNYTIENVLVSDSSFISMFNLEVLESDRNILLSEPATCIISESTATKLFGEESAIGKIIEQADRGKLKVSAIFKDLPHTSHLKADLILSRSTWRSLKWKNRYFTAWNQQGTNIYISLNKGSDQNRFQNKLTSAILKGAPWFEGVIDEEVLSNFQIQLQPMKDIHLYSSDIQWDGAVVKNNTSTLRAFALVMLLVILMASFNYINLNTASLENKNKNSGILKSMGAGRTQIFGFFLMQSLIAGAIAIVLSYFLAWIGTPYVQLVLGAPLDYLDLFNLELLLTLTGIIFSIVVLSGIYPAMLFSRVQTITNIQMKSGHKTSKMSLRSVLVTLQFIFSMFLIITLFGIHSQIKLLTSKELGFNKEQLLEIQFYKNEKNYQALVQELRKLPIIKSITAASNMPCEYINNESPLKLIEDNASEGVQGCIVGVEPNYFETFETGIINGRFFDKNLHTEEKNVLVNETAVKMLKLNSPIGKQIEFMTKKYTIIGVVKDVQYRTLRESSMPVLYSSDYSNYRKIAIKLMPGNHADAVNRVSEVWSRVFPNQSMDFSFFDEKLQNNYKTEVNQLKLFNILVIISIFILILGLLGLVLFTTEKRTKEIGIRKVNGAKVTEILAMLNRDFIKWVAIAFVIACPIAYYAMNKWLENFAYKTTLSWWIFALAGLLALGIALLTVSWQSWRAARRNPVEALRYE